MTYDYHDGDPEAAASPTTKHTPGPWRAVLYTHPTFTIWDIVAPESAFEPSGRFFGGSLPKADGTEHEYSVNEDMSEADAHLIAAAPDLLAACEAALPHHQGGHSDTGRLLRAAIAKARGER